MTPNAETVLALLIVQIGGLLIWGATLTNRVRTLEKDIQPLKEVCLACARMEVKLEGLTNELTRLNGSISWMRDPAPTKVVRRDQDPRGHTP